MRSTNQLAINWNNQAEILAYARVSVDARVGVYTHAPHARINAYSRIRRYIMTTQYRRRRGCSFSLRQIRKRIINTGDPGSMITRINSRMDELCSRSALSLSSQREKETDDARDRRKRGWLHRGTVGLDGSTKKITKRRASLEQSYLISSVCFGA